MFDWMALMVDPCDEPRQDIGYCGPDTPVEIGSVDSLEEAMREADKVLLRWGWVFVPYEVWQPQGELFLHASGFNSGPCA